MTQILDPCIIYASDERLSEAFFLTQHNYEEAIMSISQGAKANLSGQALEKDVEAVFNSLGIEFQAQVKFTNCYNNQKARMDFVVDGIAIECKRQNVGGTVDQKLPFVFEDLQAFPRGLLVLDGEHFKKHQGIHKYLNSKKSDTFDWCFFDDFADWLEANI